MTRKEKEKKVLDAFGLSIGDTVEINSANCTIIELSGCISIVSDEREYSVEALLVVDFKKVEKPKKWKDVICDNVDDCGLCPLRHINCGYGDTLQKCLDNTRLDDEEREFYQKRIDRDCKEE